MPFLGPVEDTHQLSPDNLQQNGRARSQREQVWAPGSRSSRIESAPVQTRCDLAYRRASAKSVAVPLDSPFDADEHTGVIRAQSLPLTHTDFCAAKISTIPPSNSP